MAFFETNPTLPPNAPSYVERQADRELFDGLVHGEFRYVLTSRQMGKSSLMSRTAARLRAQGFRVVSIDLQGIGSRDLTPEQWYDGLVVKMGAQLGMEDALEDFWLDNERLGPLQRLFTAMREVVLPKLTELPGTTPGTVAGPQARLVVFIDEIDAVRNLPFATDELFGAIRECHKARITDPEFQRVTFCVLGLATPADLMRDTNLTPFNLGQPVELGDFTFTEAATLARGLERPEWDAQTLLQRVLEWTHGHPYLTQRLCDGIAKNPEIRLPADVDRLCHELFLTKLARERDDNLSFVRDRLLHKETDRIGILRLYEQVRSQRAVPDNEANPLINALKMSGVVRVERGVLVVRNRLYSHVFDDDWIRTNLPSPAEGTACSLAVLPFLDESSERSEYLADGFTDELIHALGRVSGVRVASRNSVFQFRFRQPEDLRKIGTQLGVSLLLHGSVRKLGTRLRVNAELVSVPEGQLRWSTEVKYSVTQIHGIPGEIARNVTEQLHSNFGAQSPGTRIFRKKTQNLEAYNLYLKGRLYWNKRTEPDVKRSLAFFQGALAQDPSYAPALAGLADAHILLGIYNWWSPMLAYPKAKEAAIRALEIDDGLAEAHCAIGCINAVYDRDWNRAKRSFQLAVDLNPSYATAHQWFAVNCLSPLGRHSEALAHLRQAQEVDPLSITIPASVGLALHLAGRYDDAIQQCRLTLEMDETFWLTHLFLGWACEQTGLVREAIEAFHTSIERSHSDPVTIASLAYLLGRQGQTAEALQLIEKLLAFAKIRYVPAAEIAIAYLGLGQDDQAQQWLHKAQKEHSFRLSYAKVDPRLAGISLPA